MSFSANVSMSRKWRTNHPIGVEQVLGLLVYNCAYYAGQDCR